MRTRLHQQIHLQDGLILSNEQTPGGSVSMFAGVVRGPGVWRLVQQRQREIYPSGFQGKFLVQKWGHMEALSSGG